MNKEELLKELSAKIAGGEISPEEIKIFQGAIAPSRVHENEGSKTLYVLGGAIILIGIIFFVAQIWDDIGAIGRILVTLGSGLALTLAGSLMIKQDSESRIGSVMHFIGGLLVPGGALVTLYELSSDITSIWPIALTFGFIFVFYLILSISQKTQVLTFFTLVNATAFIYLLVGAITENSYIDFDLYAYLTMVIGISYILLAREFRFRNYDKLASLVFLAGTAGFLGAAFSQVFDSVPWQLFYFLLVFGGLFLSIYLKTKIILAVSTLFLIIHMSYITSEYFADSIGWPISLVILGCIFMALGYFSVAIGKKYIK